MDNPQRIGMGRALGVGAAMVRRALRARRAIDLRNRTVAIIGGSRGLGWFARTTEVE
jgi:hypothetical protein